MNREDIIRMAREAGISESHAQGMQGFLECFAALVATHEREACAKVCDQRATEDAWEGCYANACAIAIRARGSKAD